MNNLDGENSTNDITLPALNITQNDNMNETLYKIKMRSRSVLKKNGLHHFNKQKVSIQA